MDASVQGLVLEVKKPRGQTTKGHTLALEVCLGAQEYLNSSHLRVTLVMIF